MKTIYIINLVDKKLFVPYSQMAIVDRETAIKIVIDMFEGRKAVIRGFSDYTDKTELDSRAFNLINTCLQGDMGILISTTDKKGVPLHVFIYQTTLLD